MLIALVLVLAVVVIGTVAAVIATVGEEPPVCAQDVGGDCER